MDGFFLPGDCSDPGYRNVRDACRSPATDGRAYTEALWARYAPLADSHFRQDARAHFTERFWEMYLALAFAERGVDVIPGTGQGPEFSFIADEHKFWVEAVAPGPGTGPDRVVEPLPYVAYDVPTDKILLRFATAVIAKRDRFEAALKSGIVGPKDGYILAINSRRIPHTPYGNTLPYFVQALLPFGDLALRLNRRTGAVEDRFYQAREHVTKANSAAVSMQPLLDPKFAFISAVLHSCVDCVNRPEKMGADFSVLHNPLATRPLNLEIVRWCDQYSYSEGELIRTPAVE